MAFRLANLVVDIGANTGPLDGALRRVRGALSATLSGLGSLAKKGAGAVFSAFSSAASLAGSAMKAALIGVGVALAAGTAYAVDTASNLNETLSKTAVVFGESADSVMKAAQQMADAFGIPKQEFLDAASMFGLISTGMGKTKGEAAGLAVHFARLAADTASFHNIPVADALEKIRAGLTGESEPLKALGVLMDEAATKAEALRLGLARQGQELSNSAKLEARASIITKGLATANGDLARTADGVANRLRELQGRLQNLAADLGQFLLPAVKRLTGALSGALRDFKGFVEANKAQFDEWAAWLEDKVDLAIGIWKHWREALDVAKEYTKEKIQNVKEVFDWLLANIPPVMDRIGDAIVKGFEDAWKRAADVNEDEIRKLAGSIIRQFPSAMGLMSQGVEKLFGKPKDPAPPRNGPRPMVPLNFSSNPGLATAMSVFGGLRRADTAAAAADAGAKSLDEIVAEGMKARAPEAPRPSRLSERRGEQRRPAEAAGGGDFRTFTMGDWHARKAANEQAADARSLGEAIDREKSRQRAQDWHRRHPYARGLAPGEAPAVAGAMRAPTAEMKFAMDRANQKVGVTDADAYQKELTEGALKSADIQKDMLKATTDQTAVLKEIAANTKGGSARGGAGTWG